MPLTLNDLQRIIAQGENAHVDFKQEVSEQVIAGLPTDIAAFANATGGIIVFGVTDKKVPEGCVLEEKHRERISQRAQQCTPPVTIDFEEIPFGRRQFLIVHVPESKAVHSDHEDRFPIRIGDTTDYMDALSLILLIQRRGLVRGETIQQAYQPEERKRVPLPDAEAGSLARHLGSENASVRSEALRDLSTLPYRHVLFEDSRIAGAIETTLRSKTSPTQDTRLVLETLRSTILTGTEAEKHVVSGWFQDLVEIAKSPSVPTEVARPAFEILEYAGKREAVDLLVRWVRDADDERFAGLRPADMLSNIKFHGLYVPALNAMYALLQESPDERTRRRISEILEALRRSYG